MAEDIVSLKKSNGILRQAMNDKLKKNFDTLFQDYQDYQADNVDSYQSLEELYITTVDKTVNSSLNQYLKSTGVQESSKLAKMGCSLFQNWRIYRDIVYSLQSRQSRLVAGLRGQLYKAETNKIKGTAFI